MQSLQKVDTRVSFHCPLKETRIPVRPCLHVYLHIVLENVTRAFPGLGSEVCV